MVHLTKQKCVPCRGGEPTLTSEQIENLKPAVADWQVIEKDKIKKLYRKFEFTDFVKALDFTNKIGKIAEEEGHHPEIALGWGHVDVEWWTHKIKGLHNNDFIMAAKTDALFS